MTPKSVAFLQSAEGQHWLKKTGSISEQTHLQIATRLRQQLPTEQVHAIMETILLRQKAEAKFSRASQMFFTRSALEQASSEQISRYRAQRFAGVGSLADLGCGIGGDAIGLAQQAPTIGVDLDDTRLAMATANLTAYGLANLFETQQADMQKMRPLPVAGAFFDPGRREANGRRIHSVHQYHPPLAEVLRWVSAIHQVGVKVSPAIAYDEIPAHCEVEFIAVDGDLKEAVLWFGDLRTTTRRATLLPKKGANLSTLTAPDTDPTLPLSLPQDYLYEPETAVIRAHLITTLGQQLQASQIDPQIAYLTSTQPIDTPFATRYQILDYFPFQLKRLRQYLRARKVGILTIKKRGSPLDPDWLRKQLKLKGKQSALIFLTQLDGEPIVIVAQASPKTSSP